MCTNVYLGFSMSGTSVYFGRVEKDFLVQNMRHEVLRSSRHRSRTMLSKAKHLTPTPSNAARRCAQRDRQFVWQRRSHSEVEDPPGAAFFAPFLTLGHIEFNHPPLLCCNFVHYFGFFGKTGVLGGLAHHNHSLTLQVQTFRDMERYCWELRRFLRTKQERRPRSRSVNPARQRCKIPSTPFCIRSHVLVDL